MQEGDIRVSPVSRPFVVASIVLVFIGSIIGSVWMMYLLGADVAFARAVFPLHKVFQVDGFLTLIVMGIGYMIVPRFRNIQLHSVRLAYLSFLLVTFSIAISIASPIGVTSEVSKLALVARTLGILIFAGMTLWMIRIHPRLLRPADYFIALAVLTLISINVMHLFGYARSGNSLSEVQALLLFPVLMIFGVQYKTMPSFIGFIRPRKRLSTISFGLAAVSTVLVLASATTHSAILAIVFNLVYLACIATFTGAIYTFGGFDNREILSLIHGEKKARYMYTILHSRLAFLFLLAGTVVALAFNLSNSFMLYDLAIHYTTIGFIGTTIALYLPLMLPPITGKMVHFTKFNHLPILLLVTALGIRTVGDYFITRYPASEGSSFALMSTGWLIVAALSLFIVMVHRSMKEEEIS
ncbi:MAG: hypothetical protein HRF40_15030 [Nitrososphaera sp.]|jgi:hypothetical protein